jgi:hypothetical protein
VDLDRAKQADGDWVACTHLLLMAKQGGAGLKALPAQVGAMTSELLHSLGLCGTSPADLHVQVAFQAQLDKLSTPQGQCSDLPRTTADLKLTLDPNKAKATWGPALAAALQQESKAYLAQGPAAGCVTLVLHSLQQVRMRRVAYHWARQEKGSRAVSCRLQCLCLQAYLNSTCALR